MIQVNGKKEKDINPYILGGNVIKENVAYKYLGVDMENSRLWKKYKARILKKARQSFGLNMTRFMSNHYISVRSMKLSWEALTRPLLEYGAEIWGEKTWQIV